MENIEHVSFVIVVIGVDGQVEATQYWEAEEFKREEYIADAIVTYSNRHGAIKRVIVRPIIC